MVIDQNLSGLGNYIVKQIKDLLHLKLNVDFIGYTVVKGGIGPKEMWIKSSFKTCNAVTRERFMDLKYLPD